MPQPESQIVQVARKMTKASKKFFYDPSTKLDWPDRIDATEWAMSPELVSLHGTALWDAMSEAERKRLAFHEAGGFFSLVRRDLNDLPHMADLLAETAISGGTDGRYRWNGGMYDVNWQFSGTHIIGNEAALLRQQLLSRRYFQRPDADYVDVDSSRTSLSGYKLTVGHSKLSGAHWLWDVDLWAESPGFEPNE